MADLGDAHVSIVARGLCGVGCVHQA